MGCFSNIHLQIEAETVALSPPNVVVLQRHRRSERRRFTGGSRLVTR